MSSGLVQHLVDDGNIHVAKEPGRNFWWAVGRAGSFGGDERRGRVIHTANDAARTLGCGVVLHDTFGRPVKRWRPRGTPSSQLFQDAVE